MEITIAEETSASRTVIRIYVNRAGRASAYPAVDDTYVHDVCSRINRDEYSLEDALEILENEGFNPTHKERSVYGTHLIFLV
jgi:hypothetical protein